MTFIIFSFYLRKNVIMKKFFMFLFFVGATSFAQLNFYEGYIITDKEDTIKGEIKVNPKKELSLFAKIMFKDQQGITKTYKPNKINGFGYFNKENKKWHYFISVHESEPQFYKIILQHPVTIYEYQFEDMKVGGDFYTSKQYYIKHNNDYIRLKSNKLKKQLSEYIDNPDVLTEIDKMEEIDIDKLSALLEKYYSKSSS